MKSTFEKMGGTYTLGADGIYYPNLISTDEEPHYGKYGMLRKTYLKEHRPAMYSLYMLEDRLTEHLNAVDDETQEKMDILVSQMMEKQSIPDIIYRSNPFHLVTSFHFFRNALPLHHLMHQNFHSLLRFIIHKIQMFHQSVFQHIQ